jgi:hypothetical protein
MYESKSAHKYTGGKCRVLNNCREQHMHEYMYVGGCRHEEIVEYDHFKDETEDYVTNNNESNIDCRTAIYIPIEENVSICLNSMQYDIDDYEDR